MQLEPLRESLPIGVEVYRLDLDLSAHAQSSWHLLTPDERTRAGRFLKCADRERFSQTRASVRRLLARRLGCCPAEVPLSVGCHGKPFIEEDIEGVPLFNVSHSGRHALIALANPQTISCIGVDIQQRRGDLDASSVLDIAFTSQERDEARRSGDAIQALYLRWVGKEAVLKAIGVGVTEHLQRVGVRPRASRRFDIACGVPGWGGMEAMALPVPQGYAAALAWQAKEST